MIFGKASWVSLWRTFCRCLQEIGRVIDEERDAKSRPDGLDRLAMGAKAERVFLKLLRRFAEDGQTVNHNGGTNYAPKVFAEQPDNEGVQKTAFRSAMNSLLARKSIRIVSSGPPSRPVTRLEVGQE